MNRFYTPSHNGQNSSEAEGLAQRKKLQVMTKNTVSELRVAEIEEEPIELYKILKLENLVQSGGEAKFVIVQGLVQVNGEVETRKRKKIFAGDVIEFAGERIQLVIK
jgi:ribosome-associated protein